MKYKVIIHERNEDGIFIVEIPELPDCTARGSSVEEAVRNAKEAIRRWIDNANDHREE